MTTYVDDPTTYREPIRRVTINVGSLEYVNESCYVFTIAVNGLTLHTIYRALCADIGIDHTTIEFSQGLIYVKLEGHEFEMIALIHNRVCRFCRDIEITEWFLEDVDVDLIYNEGLLL